MKRINVMPHMAQRIFGTPLAIEPGKLGVILHAVGGRVLGVDSVEVDLPAEALLPAKAEKADRESVVSLVDGVAVFDLHGTLVHRSSWMDAASGLLSYQQVADEFRAAVENPQVKAILLSLNSPGGEVSGLAELADEVFAARKSGKRIVAVASDMACSAAYWIGSAASEFYATESAAVGSIGVVVAHMDVSEADKKAGVKVTHIHAGARKVDGNPHEPLTDEGRETLQALVDKTYSVFVSKVAKFRGISPDAVRKTEARVFIGADAKAAGLVNGIRSTRDVLNEMRGRQPSLFPGNGAAAFTGWVAVATGDGGYEARRGLPLRAPDIESLMVFGDGQEGSYALAEAAIPRDPHVAAALAQLAAPDSSEGDPAPENPPAEDKQSENGDTTTEVGMTDTKKPLEANADLLARIEKLEAEKAEALQSAKAAMLDRNREIVAKHVSAGRVTPAMAKGAAIKALVESMDAEGLDRELSNFPQVTRPHATGVPDAEPPRDEIPTNDATSDLHRVAADLQKKNPALTSAQAMKKACELRPDLYLAQRGFIGGREITGRA